MANQMILRLAIVLGLFFVSACSGGESLETESATIASGSSEFFDALPEVPDGYGNDEYLKFGALVLIDDDGEAVPSGNPGAERFVVEVVALRERSGEVVYNVIFSNAEEPSMIGINWQCEGGDRIGLLRSNQDGQFSFRENGQPDTEAGFDLNAGPGCEGTIAPHPAGAQLFGDELLTVASEPQGVRFATEGGVSWLFEVRELGLSEVSATVAPPTTVETGLSAGQSDDENQDQSVEGFGDLSAFVTETATFTGPTGRSVTLVDESPDAAIPFELFLIIGEWTESYQQEVGGEVVLSDEIAHSFEIAYSCSLTSGWLTHVDGSAFQWRGGFPPSGDESGEDCDAETSDLTFVNNFFANADNINLEVINNTLSISFEGYEATWIPRS